MEYLFAGFLLVLIIAMTISLVLYLQKNDRKEKIQCERMLMDVFEMQIKQPELSLVYDAAKIGADPNLMERYELSKEPFIIYILSVFDLVIDYYFSKNLLALKDPLMKAAWINTIRNFYQDSTDGRLIYLAHHDEFNRRFQKFSDNVVKSLNGEEVCA